MHRPTRKRAAARYLLRLVASSPPRVHLHAPCRGAARYTILHLAAIEINVSHALDSIYARLSFPRHGRETGYKVNLRSPFRCVRLAPLARAARVARYLGGVFPRSRARYRLHRERRFIAEHRGTSISRNYASLSAQSPRATATPAATRGLGEKSAAFISRNTRLVDFQLSSM